MPSKALILFLLASVLMGASSQAQERVMVKGAGRWFPADAQALDAMVVSFLMKAEAFQRKGRIVGALAPHAGYVYSGSTAGFTYRVLKDNALLWGEPETVVILGPSHRRAFEGIALMDGSEVLTPLGSSALDRDGGLFLARCMERCFFSNSYHDGEHSVENQIPFVQKVFPKAGVIAAVMGDHSMPRCLALASCLADLVKKRKLIVIASSDMYHDPSYETVSRLDKESLKRISQMDYRGLAAEWSHERQSFCGIAPMVTLMRFAEIMGAGSGQVLHYRNSGDDYPESRGRWVVGYGSAVFLIE
jgi:AmmeMemoRadiSam system protein B